MFRSVDELLDADLEFDAAAICTPPQVRKDVCDRMIRSGRAILLEKPPASSLSEAKSLADAAEANGSILFAAWHSRFFAHFEAAQNWVSENRIVIGEIEWRENAEKWHPGQSWLWEEGGFGVFDPGINALSILTSIFPNDWRVANVEMRCLKNAAAPSLADFTLDAPGVTVSVSLEFHQREEEIWRIRLLADTGEVLELSDGGATLQIGQTKVRHQETREYDGVYRQFEGLVRENKSDFDLEPLRLAELALKSGLETN